MEEKPIILAAGKGTRMWPLTTTRPKPSLPVGGEPLICRHVRMLSEYYDEIVVVIGYKGDILVSLLEGCKRESLRIKYVRQEKELGTGHALLSAIEKGVLSGVSRGLVIHGDIYVSEQDFRDFIENEAEIGVAVVDEPWNYGVLEIREGLVRHIVEKPSRGEEPSNLIYAGLLRINTSSTDILKRLEPSPRGEIEIADLIEHRAKESGLKYHLLKKWIDVGRPWDLLKATRHALEEMVDNNCNNMPCIVEEDSYGGAILVSTKGANIIDESTVIEGPAYLGAGVKVRPHSYLRAYNVLMDGSLVGSHVEVKGSILLEHAKVPHLSYIGDSVIGEYSNLGAGTITANFRFDGLTVKSMLKGKRIDTGLRKLGAIIGGHVRTGINVSLLPGVKIGAHSWIYPGCIVTRDLPENTILKCRQSQVVAEMRLEGRKTG